MAEDWSAGPEVDPAIAEPANPLQQHLGFRMVAWEADLARFELPLQPYHLNRYGIPHGGLHVTLLDTAMGYAGSYTGTADKRLAMTLTLSASFVGQPQGSMLICEGRRVGGGKRTFFAEGTVTDDLGTLVATGTGAFRIRGG